MQRHTPANANVSRMYLLVKSVQHQARCMVQVLQFVENDSTCLGRKIRQGHRSPYAKHAKDAVRNSRLRVQRWQLTTKKRLALSLRHYA
jgi:hypothetical protein